MPLWYICMRMKALHTLKWRQQKYGQTSQGKSGSGRCKQTNLHYCTHTHTYVYIYIYNTHTDTHTQPQCSPIPSLSLPSSRHQQKHESYSTSTAQVQCWKQNCWPAQHWSADPERHNDLIICTHNPSTNPFSTTIQPTNPARQEKQPTFAAQPHPPASSGRTGPHSLKRRRNPHPGCEHSAAPSTNPWPRPGWTLCHPANRKWDRCEPVPSTTYSDTPHARTHKNKQDTTYKLPTTHNE